MITLSIAQPLTLDDVRAIAYEGVRVTIEPASLAEIGRRREVIERYVRESNSPAYGFNRGFGHNVDVAVRGDLCGKLQENFLRSHSCGVGPLAPKEIVRATMLLRLQSLLRGHSGVRPEVLSALSDLLNEGVTPAVPLYGAVGASGDLAPLSHIGLALIGEGEVLDEVGGVLPAAEVLRAKGITPLRLAMKEGLALSNGSQFTNAIGILVLQLAERALRAEIIATALAIQVMLGSDVPFDAALQELRPFDGPRVASSWVRRLVKDSPIRAAHGSFDLDGEVQDPYNLRCAPAILGSCVELLDEAAIAFEREANSATDNPLILPDLDGRWTRIVSGGHFHGMPLAIRMHGIQQAFAMIASLCNARCQRYVDRYRNKGLGNVLLWPRLTDDERQVSSGMMIPEYASAALTNVIIGAATPSHLFSISTDSGQEDHVSMGTGLAVRTWETAPRVAEVVAIELAYAAQAAWIRRETSRWPSKRTLSPAQREGLSAQYAQLGNDATRAMGAPFHLQAELHAFFEVQEEERRLSPLCERILELMAGIFPPVTEDRVFSTDLRALANAVLDGSIVAVAEREGVFRRER